MPKDHDQELLLEELRASREANAAILALVAALTDKLGAKPSADPWADRAAEIKRQVQDRPLRDRQIVKDQMSPFTGATFDAVTCDGVVITLENYRYHPRFLHRVIDGGEIPNEMLTDSPRSTEVVDRLDRTAITTPYLQWLYESSRKVDLRSIVGCPLNGAIFSPQTAPPKFKAEPQIYSNNPKTPGAMPPSAFSEG
jgi:hypothetical protein